MARAWLLFGLAVAGAGLALVAGSRRRSATDPRAAVVATALGELGQQDPEKYWREVLPPEDAGGPFPPHWCGGFALWVLRRAGLAQSIDWQIGKGFCFNLPQTTRPKPGDVAYFELNQHHAIVVGAEGDELVTVDGNQPGQTVQRRTRRLSEATAFFSIDPLLEVTA